MRLLQWNGQNKISLTPDFTDEKIPAYAILSHTWAIDNSEEVTFAEVQTEKGQKKAGHRKIQFCAAQARKDGIKYFWVDTCCIDKTNNTELSEAITSMYRWYQNAAKCYVYLPDVVARTQDHGGDAQSVWESSFRCSRWFTRGWTLQELLAPTVVEFYSGEGAFLGTKETLGLQIYQITTIPLAALRNTPLSQFSIDERIRWTHQRQTKRKEDKAYSLLGIFEVFMPFIYGEGDNAMRRLQKEINDRYGPNVAAALSNDHPTRSLGLCFKSAPLIQPADFVGRAVEIDAIHRTLRPDHTLAEQQRVVLGGMGGLGKTQLALAYARQHQPSYTSVLWLNATSESTLFSSLRSVAAVLVRTTELETLDNEQVLAHILMWLSRPDNTRWLLIFDNHDDPDLFNIDHFCPGVGHGSVIITTRLPDRVTGEQLRVQPLQIITDSLAILQIRSGRKAVQHDIGARCLAQRLAGLPLALVSAGTFLRKSTLTFQQYFDAYEQRWQIDPRRPLRLQDYQDRTLYTTWNISFSRLEKEDPSAAHLLRLLAYFDNQEVWSELLCARSSHDLSEELRGCLDEQISFESVMSTLVDYCLVELQHTSGSYSMHSCVHDWVLGELNAKISPVLYWYAFDCVRGSISSNDWGALGAVKYARVSRHGIRLTHHRFRVWDQLSDGLFKYLEGAVWIAEMLKGQVQFSAAVQMYQQALTGYETVLGPDHTSTLDTVNNLGSLYADQGKREQAEQMYLRALAGFETALGPDHTSTLRTVNNFGTLYRDQGKLEQAEQMYLRALAGYKTALGPDHTSTYMTVTNLGALYADQGKLDQAERMYLCAQAGFETALGPDHALTLSTVNNLALLYRDQGKLDEAEQMYLRTLARRETVLGPDHTSTLNTVGNLGLVYADQGKLDQAERMYLRALAGYETSLGPDHTSTLNTVNNLGVLYKNQGKLDEAEQVYLRTLARYESVLGPDHNSTLDTVGNLGNLYADQGKLDQAECMYSRVLAGYETVLGSDHTSTLRTVNNLGILYKNQGKLEQAEQMYLRALAGFETALGPDHTSTLDTVNNLGNVYADQGKLDKAERTYMRALAGYKIALGPDHASTLTTVYNLNALYRDQGKLD